MKKDFISTHIEKAFSSFNGKLVAVFTVVFILQSIVIYFVGTALFDDTNSTTIVTIFVAGFALLLAGFVAYSMADQVNGNIREQILKSVREEVYSLETSLKRAQALQGMASTLRATQSFDHVMEQALDVCSLALEELGTSGKSLIAGVFLYEGNFLMPVATRRFNGVDAEKPLVGKEGLIGEALNQAVAMVTSEPMKDPELGQLSSFKKSKSVVCIPLRAGFQIFGAMVIGSDTAVDLDETHVELFNVVADQVVIALQNAQLYQDLEKEKERIIKADEDARKELARDLHDGPTQSIAAIAMRINFIRSLVKKNSEQALVELEKVEDLAKQTSKDIRGMLFTLRPLVLETQGLSKAIETVIKKLRDTDGLNVRMVGGDYGDMLSEGAQTVVFSIVEEALGNARKYSKASLIEVRMWQEDNLFVARIQDDGVGFDAESVNENYSSRGSLGLINMKERAARVDGSLKLDTSPGRGTAWTLVVPLQKHGRRVSAR